MQTFSTSVKQDLDDIRSLTVLDNHSKNKLAIGVLLKEYSKPVYHALRHFNVLSEFETELLRHIKVNGLTIDFIVTLDSQLQPSEIIKCAFEWGKSPQGSYYWSDINDKVVAHLLK